MLFLICWLFMYKFETAEHQIFSDWLNAQQGEVSWESFMNKAYTAEALQKINMQDHIQFYQTIQQEFGKLQPSPYRILKDKPGTYMVYMVRQGQDVTKDVAPEHILVVTVELDPGASKLTKSLGLGALICYQKK